MYLTDWLASHRKTIVIFVILLVISAIPRFYDLGRLGFYSDEDLTSFAARSLRFEREPKMPSGMPYYRALPHTWMNALSASIFGWDREESYRFSSALFGTLTVPLLFLFARKLFGGPVALVAAVLLAFSEWHIQNSREARMYAHFLLFYMLSGFATLHWAITAKRRWVIGAAVLFASSISFHFLGIMGIMFAIVPILFLDWSKVSPLRLTIFSLFAGMFTWVYRRVVVQPSYDLWMNKVVTIPNLADNVGRKSGAFLWLPDPLNTVSLIAILALMGGLFVGIILVRGQILALNIKDAALRTISLYISAAVCGALTFLGLLYGASLFALLFLLLYPGNILSLWKGAWKPIIILIVVSSLWIIGSISMLGVYEGLRQLVFIPFPYPLFLLEVNKGVFVLFVIGAFFLAVCRHQQEEHALSTCVLAVLLPVITIGLVKKWGGLRYLLEIYPFLLLVSSATLIRLLKEIGSRCRMWSQKTATVIAVIIASSGILGAHGLPQTLKIISFEQGKPLDVPLIFHSRMYYPDHKTPGEFVRMHLRPSDIVVAEDDIEQTWYAGRVNYGLTKDLRHKYVGSDGRLRSIYSDVIRAEKRDLMMLSNNKKNRIWIISASQKLYVKERTLTLEQKTWIENIESSHSPLFTGRDGHTKVYCLNCDKTRLFP